MSLKLCIVTPSHWNAVRGGSQYQAKVLVDYLLKHYDVRVTYLTTRTDPAYQPPAYEIVKFSEPTGLRRFAFFFDAFRLYRALKRTRPDVILQIVGCAHTGIAAFYAKHNGARMVWRISSDRSVVRQRIAWWRPHKHIEQAFLNYGIRNSDLILAQSRFQQSQVARRFGRDDAALLPNFHPALPPAVRRQRYPLQVVWIANLKPTKNPAAFVRLASRSAAMKNVQFTMIGRAAGEDEWMKQQLDDIARTPNLTYLGERSQHDVNMILGQSALLVNTSDIEGFSNTFIQAWMNGVPVVSLRVNPDGLLTEGGLGVLSGDESQLYRDVRDLLDAPTRRTVMGAHCRAYAEANHSEANIDVLARMLYIPEARGRTSTEPASAAR